MAFVQDFLDVAVGFDAAVVELGDVEPGWLAILAEKGVRDGQALRLRLAPKETAIALPSRCVRIDLERPYRRGDRWVMPFHWAGTAVPALFQAMDAELSVAPLGAAEVRLTFSARYQPPVSSPGQVVDALLLQRVVERSVRSFLFALGDAVLRRATSRAATLNSA
jgi:hypothetical protein